MMFSIVIPMYNASEHIYRTLKSCTQQTVFPKEIIIVDDCSSDDSCEIVEKWKEQYDGEVTIILKHLEVNSGPSKARNTGWDLASGEYISFLDADDLFSSNKLEVVKRILTQSDTIVLLGHEYGIGKIGTNSEAHLEKIKVTDFLRKNYFTTSAVVVKREVEERFDETMRYTEDHDLFLRLTEQYDQTYSLNQKLVLRERGMNESGGLSGNLWEMRKGELQMYKKYCKTNGIVWLYPIFVLFSLSKHGMKWLKGLV